MFHIFRIVVLVLVLVGSMVSPVAAQATRNVDQLVVTNSQGNRDIPNTTPQSTSPQGACVKFYKDKEGDSIIDHYLSYYSEEEVGRIEFIKDGTVLSADPYTDILLPGWLCFDSDPGKYQIKFYPGDKFFINAGDFSTQSDGSAITNVDIEVEKWSYPYAVMSQSSSLLIYCFVDEDSDGFKKTGFENQFCPQDILVSLYQNDILVETKAIAPTALFSHLRPGLTLHIQVNPQGEKITIRPTSFPLFSETDNDVDPVTKTSVYFKLESGKSYTSISVGITKDSIPQPGTESQIFLPLVNR